MMMMMLMMLMMIIVTIIIIAITITTATVTVIATVVFVVVVVVVAVVVIVIVYLPCFGKVSPKGHDFLGETDFCRSCKVFRHQKRETKRINKVSSVKYSPPGWYWRKTYSKTFGCFFKLI